MAKFATHMRHPHCRPVPQHADPHGLLVSLSLKTPQVHVDRCVVGWSAGRHVGGKFRHGLLEKSLMK